MAAKNKPLDDGEVDLTVVRQLVDLWRQGMLDREIADAMNVKPVYVQCTRKFLGLAPRRKHASTRSRRDAVAALAEKGLKVEEISKLIGVEPYIIRRWV